MKKAEYSDKHIVVNILSSAFQSNKSVVYAVGNSDARMKRLMRYAFDLCFYYGEIFLSEGNEGCILFISSHRKATLRSTIMDFSLAICTIGLRNIFKIFEREKRIKENHPSFPFRHLWFIGVSPDCQGSGVGSRLLTQALSTSNLPVYLETSVVENIAWYEKFNFKVFQEIHLSYRLYLLRKQ